MKPEALIKIAVEAGCEYEEYDSHYCIRSNMEVTVIITIPKVKQLASQLVEKAKEMLGLWLSRRARAGSSPFSLSLVKIKRFQYQLFIY